MSNLNNFLKLVDKKVLNMKTSADKEKLHKNYINLFFSLEQKELIEIREKEKNWIAKNKLIELYNNLFKIDLCDININNYLVGCENFIEEKEKKNKELIFKFHIDNNIKINKKYLENIILKDS